MNSAADFFDSIAKRILNAHAAAIPDLRGITVLLPNFHVAQPLAHSLMRVAQRPALLLPQMVTLNEWAKSIPIDLPVVTDAQRSALLYQLLRDKKWFEQADLWSMTQELLALFDELTHSLNALPVDAEVFASAVQQAYQARQNSSLQLEARLVFELWHAMQSGEELDKARTYQLRLAKLAEQARQPLFVLRTSDWNSLEQLFLEQYAAKADVVVCDLREMVENTPSPLCDKLRFFAATSLEQEARAAAMQVRLWLQQGKRDIAIVAQDRVVARRMRALLERAEVLITDETGWTFATLSVSTVLDRWLTALQSDFYHHDLLDLLKSPFIFADTASSERKAAVYQLEQLLRKQGVVAGLEKFIAVAEHEVVLHQPLARLRQATALLEQDKKKPWQNGWGLCVKACTYWVSTPACNKTMRVFNCWTPWKLGNKNWKLIRVVTVSLNGGAGWRSNWIRRLTAIAASTARCVLRIWQRHAGALSMRCYCWAAIPIICPAWQMEVAGLTMPCVAV